MKRVCSILMFVSLFVSLTGFSQSGEWWKRDKKDSSDSVSKVAHNDTVYERGTVTVKKDSRIEKLIEFKSAKIPPATAPKKDGFRVQLFFDQDRKQVDEARSKMLQIDADADTYVEYKAPNYNLLLGNYRTRLEAEKVRASLLEEFPEAIIVKDRIYFPEIKED